mmetsp:Transcript_17846/g.40807  ORF Transcript_17846/g.40807 Transcript_17846/m.40807 type:complete len:162 (+) Transcript_17846:152-637(+)
MTRLQQQSGLVIALGLTTAVSSFSLQGASGPRMYHTQIGMSSPDGNGEDEEPHLVLGDMESEMQDVRANSGMEFDFGAIDYLAAAKARAAAQVQSNNDVAGVEEWTALAEEKKEQFGEIDDWENSQKEAGNADSHILMFTEPPSEEGEGDGEDDEPKLLLF